MNKKDSTWYTSISPQNFSREFWQLPIRLVMRDFRHFRFKHYIKCCPLWRNFFLRQEFNSCDRKCLSVTGNLLLWQDISSCDRKFLSVTKFLTLNLFPGSKFSQQKCVIFSHISKSWQKYLIFVKNPRVQGFVGRFLQPCPLKSHPAWSIGQVGLFCTIPRSFLKTF